MVTFIVILLVAVIAVLVAAIFSDKVKNEVRTVIGVVVGVSSMVIGFMLFAPPVMVLVGFGNGLHWIGRAAKRGADRLDAKCTKLFKSHLNRSEALIEKIAG